MPHHITQPHLLMFSMYIYSSAVQQHITSVHTKMMTFYSSLLCTEKISKSHRNSACISPLGLAFGGSGLGGSENSGLGACGVKSPKPPKPMYISVRFRVTYRLQRHTGIVRDAHSAECRRVLCGESRGGELLVVDVAMETSETGVRLGVCQIT